MIRPTRHMDLQTCVVNTSATLVAALRVNGPMKYDEIVRTAEDELGQGARHQVPSALAILYALGAVEYSTDTDAAYLTAPQDSDETE